MLDRGLTEDGAAQALGWPKQPRHRAREDPRAARARAAADRRRRHPPGRRRPAARDRHGRARPARRRDRLPRRRQRVGRRAADPRARLGARRRPHATPATARCSPPTCTPRARTRSPSCGWARRPSSSTQQAEKLHKQLDRYAYGPPQVRFTDEDVDQARAAGVLIEFERGRPIIVDRPLYRELVKTAIKRTHDELDAKADGGRQGEEDRPRRPSSRRTRSTVGQARARRAAARADRPGARRQPRPRPRADPQPRQPSTRPTSTSRGSSSTRCSGADHDSSPYTQTGERIARIAAGGIRLVDRRAAHRRHQDAQGRQPRPAARSTTATTATREAAIAWLWKFVDGAKTAGELYGRALVVIAAEQHATRLVVPVEPADARHPLELAQGHRRQGAAGSSPARTSPRR